MKRGYLSDYFTGVAFKRLSVVEVDEQSSNQHEFNGVKEFRELFGKEKATFPAQLIYLSDSEEEGSAGDGKLTWYDSRENHPSRSEYRFYYTSKLILEKAAADDLLVLARKKDGVVLLLIAPAGSTIENQIMWLFGIDREVSGRPGVVRVEKASALKLIAKTILEKIGIPVSEENSSLETKLLENFPGEFPTTEIFSEFARNVAAPVNILEDPDNALMVWLEQEETNFRLLEKVFLQETIKKGFSTVDTFVAFSLSVQNRRKSRAGKAFENHLRHIFYVHKIRYSQGKITEAHSRPDFLFPSIESYQNPDFPEARLTMLGVKTSCKDRWRQVLSEGKRILLKHLITLEAGISVNQTDEMKGQKLQLVVPAVVFATYTKSQQAWLLRLVDFMDCVKARQT